MNCYEFESQLSNFIDGDISSQLRKEFLSHRSECPDCDRFYLSIKHTVSAVHGLQKVSVSRDFNKTLWARIVQERQPSPWRKVQEVLTGSTLPKYVASTAVIIFMSILGYGVLQQHTVQNSPVNESGMSPPPTLKTQQSSVNEALPGDMEQSQTDHADKSDTNTRAPASPTPSFEGQIRYVKGD